MLFSKFFVRTLRDSPRDVVLKSHSYLIRGGFVSQTGSGMYNFLPLGHIVLENIKRIVRDEMNMCGAHEVSMAFVNPSSLWQRSGRYHRYGRELGSFRDRRGAELILGPTHEECATDLASQFLLSYKQLPVNIYQINLKFRDELRPRSGLLRSREFVMKDSYGFHASGDSLDAEIASMEQLYSRIFTRLGLNFVSVEADSGSIGGGGSKEFIAISDAGEDDILLCDKCGYCANVEVATRSSRVCDSIPPQATPPYHKFSTPGVSTVGDLSRFFNVDSFYLIKAVVKGVHLGDREDVAVFFLRGTDELEDTKALKAVKKVDDSAVHLYDLDDAAVKRSGLPVGYVGPISLKTIISSEFVFFDNDLSDAQDLICGANEPGYHYVGVNLGEFSGVVYDDISKVSGGDPCPKCCNNLRMTSGVEIGHIFRLGDLYSRAMNATFLNGKGESQFFEMGCYGIGITRLLSVILEQKGDDRGCVWGPVAPFTVDIVVSNVRDSLEFRVARGIYDELLSRGVKVILDDREERFGSKIGDFELIGFEYAVIVGRRLKDGVVEVVRRDGLLSTDVVLSDIFRFLLKSIGVV